MILPILELNCLNCYMFFCLCWIITCFYLCFNFCLLIDNVDLGTACGKYYRVGCLSIIDPGMYSFLTPEIYHLMKLNIIMLYNKFAGDSDIIKSLPSDHWRYETQIMLWSLDYLLIASQFVYFSFENLFVFQMVLMIFLILLNESTEIFALSSNLFTIFHEWCYVLINSNPWQIALGWKVKTFFFLEQDADEQNVLWDKSASPNCSLSVNFKLNNQILNIIGSNIWNRNLSHD